MPTYTITEWMILCFGLSDGLRAWPRPEGWISTVLANKFAFLEDFEAEEKESSIDEATCVRLPPDWWGTPASDDYMRAFSWLAWETRKLTEAEQETILRVVEQVRQPSGSPALPLRDRLVAAGAVVRPE